MSRLVPRGGRARTDICQQVAVDGQPTERVCERRDCDKRVYRMSDHHRCYRGHKQREDPTHHL